jgi:coenzyme F420 biosynthesis associated uncharacterized protein
MSTAVDWEFAKKVAAKVSGKDDFAESYHRDSLEPDFIELTKQAEELVSAETGLIPLSGPARPRVAERSDWIEANVNSFQRLLSPFIEKMEAKMTPGPSTMIGSKVAGTEVGVMLGWMSSRVLGQYDMLVVDDVDVDDQDIVYYVGPNVLGIEKKYGFPPREFRLWLALHEVTHRAQFTGVPWMRDYFLSLVNELVGSVEPDPQRFSEALRRMAETIRRGENPLDDGGLAGMLASDEQKATIDKIGGLMSLLEGHGDITMDRAGLDLLPSAPRFGRVLRARRQQAGGMQKMVQKLVGLEAKMAQYEQGEIFIEYVEGNAGREVMDRVWESPEHVPSLTEIREPQLWIDRMSPRVAVGGA